MIRHTIHNLVAREILDSRGEPTIEVKVELGGNITATASVPSGASTGLHEAMELRDKDSSRYGGKGVLKAVESVNKIIAPAFKGFAVMDQEAIDNKLISLDGTQNKSKLGANAILGVSLACARVAASAWNIPLYKYLRHAMLLPVPEWDMPVPMMNFINGGRHADSNLSVQEIMAVPRILKNSGKKTVVSASESIRAGSEIFHNLGQILKQNNLDTDLGNEGGYAPDFKNIEQALDFLMAAIKKSSYRAGIDVGIALDVAASEFFMDNNYNYSKQRLSGQDMQALYNNWVDRYPIWSIEDGLHQDDWAGWSGLTAALGNRILLVGDDLFVTNKARLEQGISQTSANAIIIKPNQIGTLTEVAQTIKLAKENNYKIVVSHRSGETDDDFISDLSVAVGADFIKAGSVARGERVAKYNRLLAIEQELSK